ncbi:MAG: hypothetical protein PHS95_02010 [Candidatus Pacebacteria bacterium]|nr:hypothetical protein [Candidatus Paceibacterota bacterium]
MSIKDFAQKIKGLAGFRPKPLPRLSDELFIGLLVILVGFGSFGLGRLSKIEGSKTPIQIENAPAVTADTFATGTQPSTLPTNIGATSKELMGSKNGTKYYYTWCAGANRITEANRIYFNTKEEAEARGYTPASNCKGL